MRKKQAVVDARGRRTKDKGLEELRLALARLQRRGSKINITAVAVEAGYKSGSVIHNVYPAFGQEILALTGKALRAQRDRKHVELVAEKADNRQLRDEVASLKADLAKLASINLSLQGQLRAATASADPKVVPLRGPKAPKGR